jgi:hypothetical protein
MWNRRPSNFGSYTIFTGATVTTIAAASRYYSSLANIPNVTIVSTAPGRYNHEVARSRL